MDLLVDVYSQAFQAELIKDNVSSWVNNRKQLKVGEMCARRHKWVNIE